MVGFAIRDLKNMRQIRAEKPDMCGDATWRYSISSQDVDVRCDGIGVVKFKHRFAVRVLKALGVGSMEELCRLIMTPPPTREPILIENEGW